MPYRTSFLYILVRGQVHRSVTTTRVTHATPAAMYSHSASRYWESDGKIPKEDRAECKDIARQLVEDDPGRNINVSIKATAKLSSQIKCMFCW
ncbi:alkaline phosphatase, tissue-nonspecific isozyme [Trichonephila inaurata madagascariensis]|uniref:alkaline phosphatase n=1 Tax=Trichonephila inaurata madagascariensis TaxID=2747483 RepID=A0A8X6X0G1_9ARAC|nr:alkaline phosphatase, tissue-nonspecific isozyme [Trichonephila inaurata madagascariensis]